MKSDFVPILFTHTKNRISRSFPRQRLVETTETHAHASNHVDDDDDGRDDVWTMGFILFCE